MWLITETHAPVARVGRVLVRVARRGRPSQASRSTALRVLPCRCMAASARASSPSTIRRRLSETPGSLTVGAPPSVAFRTGSRTSWMSPSPLERPLRTRSFAHVGSTFERSRSVIAQEAPLRPVLVAPTRQTKRLPKCVAPWAWARAVRPRIDPNPARSWSRTPAGSPSQWGMIVRTASPVMPWKASGRRGSGQVTLRFVSVSILIPPSCSCRSRAPSEPESGKSCRERPRWLRVGEMSGSRGWNTGGGRLCFVAPVPIQLAAISQAG